MDRNERRIVTPAAAGLKFPDTSTMESPCSIPGRIQEPGVKALAFESISQYEDLDINGHVNNARYISWLCNALGMKAFENASIRTLVVSYDKEIRGTLRIKHLIRYENGAFAYRVTDDIGEKCFSASGEIGVEK